MNRVNRWLLFVSFMLATVCTAVACYQYELFAAGLFFGLMVVVALLLIDEREIE